MASKYRQDPATGRNRFYYQQPGVKLDGKTHPLSDNELKGAYNCARDGYTPSSIIIIRMLDMIYNLRADISRLHNELKEATE